MESPTPEESNLELEQMATEQIRDINSDVADQLQRGEQRRQRVNELSAQGMVRTGPDNYHAALIMLYGNGITHYEQARAFAKQAAALGEPRAWSIIATAWDQMLLARGQPQRFGTQFVRENGHWTLGRVDPRITDSQRALYGVPPLWVQQQNAEQLRRNEEEP